MDISRTRLYRVLFTFADAILFILLYRRGIDSVARKIVFNEKSLQWETREEFKSYSFLNFNNVTAIWWNFVSHHAFLIMQKLGEFNFISLYFRCIFFPRPGIEFRENPSIMCHKYLFNKIQRPTWCVQFNELRLLTRFECINLSLSL